MPKRAPTLRDQRRLNARTLRAMVRRARALAPVVAMRTRSLGHRAVLLMGTILSAHTSMAQSLPQGGVVVGGSASIGQPTASQMVITQSTQRAAINWQSFNIGAGNGVQVVQPSTSAILVNRVVGLSGPSQIAGTLTANGQVYIVNPQGVVFGKGAMVNVGALVATTRDVNPEQFMAGGNITLAGGSTGNGRVVNAGAITTAPGGYVVLAGDRVVNKGTIDTPNGRTVLAAGDQATVALSNGQLVNVTMNAAVANATVKNGGVIKAAGGKVVLSANGANSVLGGAVNVSGAIDVSAALAGDITIDAGPAGTVCASGASLKAVSSAGKGGSITVTGDRVGLFAGTKLNASGTTGGGTVKVGGGAHGDDPTVRNAGTTVVDPTASIDASATDKGDGGTVVVWSQDYTGFYGTITAQGGPNGGNGGWIETSSHDNLQALGHVVLGEGGTWLLDPSNVTIANASTSGDTFNSSSGVWVPSANSAIINASEINAQLNDGTTVIVTTNSSRSQDGNLNINASIAKTAGGNASLTLRANGTLFDNGATISSTVGKLNVTMNASDGIVLANGSAFSLHGGNLTITGTSTDSTVGVNIGQITINAAAATIIGTTNSGAYAVNVFGVLDASAAPQLTINGTNGTTASVDLGATVTANALTVNGVAKANGTGIVVGSTVTAAGNVTLNGTGNGSGNGTGVDIAGDIDAQHGMLTITGKGNGNFGAVVTGSACASGTVTINGSSSDGIAVNVAGTVNSSNGSVTITGASSTGRGVRLSGIVAAAGTVTVTGSADNANGIAVPGNLTLTAAGGATLTGTANTANGINISATLESTGTPLLTLNGTAGQDGNLTFYGVAIPGTVNAANLSIIGSGLSGVEDTGGVLVTGAALANGNMTINGSANNGIAVNLTGSLNASAGSLTINGTSSTGRGVRLSGTIAASGIVNITGSADNANGIAVPGNLTLAAAGGATLTGTANTANGINVSATLDATGTPLLTLNGTATDSGNLTFYGVAVAGAVNGADLAVIGRGLSGANDAGGVNIAGSTVASGNLTINGGANAGIAVNLTGAVNATGGNVTINGNSSTGRGVRLAGTVAASGTVNVTGTSNTANGLVVPTNLTATVTAGGGATLIGNASAANGINISGTLDSTGTPLLTLNGTSTANNGGFYGVNVPGNLTVANLTVNGLGNLNATGDVGGTFVSGTVNGTGNLTLNGQSNGTFAGVFLTGQAAAGGSITVNGAGNAKYGVNASGVLNAGGTVTINGTSNGTIGVLLNTSLNIAANGGATVNAQSNSTHGFFFGGVLDATRTPLLTINGSTLAADNAYGVSFNGTANVANLVLNGTGNLSAVADVGGVTFGGTANAGGTVNVIGQSNGTFAGIFFNGNIAAGSVALNGTGNNRYGVNASGTVNATGTVTIDGTSDGTTGVLLNSKFNLSAGGGATIIARSNSTNGFFFAGLLNASGTPQLTINGTSATAGGGYNGIAFTGNASVANLTLNGIGNLSATGNVGGTTFNGTASASGNVTVNGQSNGGLQAVRFAGGIVSCGSIVVNGSARAAYGVDAGGTLNAGGATTIIGASDSNVGVFVGGCLTVSGNQGGTVVGSTNTGQYGVSLANGSALSVAGPLTVNGTGGVAASGSLSAGGNVTLNANRFALNGASFSGAAANVVLQALNASSAMSVDGSGASFGNVASVRIGSTSQAADLTLAAPLTYAGVGNLTVVTGVANIALNANIDASAGSGSVILSAGNGVPLNASQSNGNVTGGDVLVGCVTSLAAGEGGTVVIYSGNANSAAYAALVANGATSQTKAYSTLAGAGDVRTPSALNLFYRVVPSLTVTLGNATGASVTKAYDGVGVALGYNVTGMIDGNSPGAVTLTGNLAASAPLTGGTAMHAANYTISQGNATFTSDSHYAISVANGSIVITPKALIVTATSDTKVFDGSTSSNATMTVCGTIAGDSFSTSALGEAFASAAVAGANNSILLPAEPLGNASFATSTAGSWIGDYSITYVAALGTILPTNGGSTVVIVPPTQTSGLASADVVSLGSWLNSGGQQQNLPPGLAMNDNVLHLMFTTSDGQPIIQASWAAFNSNYSGTINLPANTNPSP